MSKAILVLDKTVVDSTTLEDLQSDTANLQLEPTLDVESLSDSDQKAPWIIFNFEAFRDGRAFSQVRILREQMGFQGNLLATGNFLADQVEYMTRCGFNAFAFEGDNKEENSEVALKLLNNPSFSMNYQSDAQGSQPFYQSN